jgi:cytochrome c oxidase subunit 2
VTVKRQCGLCLAVSSATLAAISCAGHQQSMVDAAGPQAGRIQGLWWFFFWVLAAVFIIIMVLTLISLMRRSPESPAPAPTQSPDRRMESQMMKIVTGATIATIVILFVFLVASIGAGKSISELPNKKNGITIEVTGNQWWWQIRYLNSNASQVLTTADEMHIPVGRPIQIRGMSNDVIHSFWVPNLHGKRDLIPSRVTIEWIEADRPGVYRGQCAEFCGMQHAHMILWVIAEPEDKFDAWMRHQLQESAAPSNAVLARGKQVFLNNACVFCHTIRGTTAAGQNAPDLTHFASRRGLAANTVPNTKGNLAGWITDPQSLKPGNHMAQIALNPADLQPLIDYLESLK